MKIFFYSNKEGLVIILSDTGNQSYDTAVTNIKATRSIINENNIVSITIN